MGASLAAAKEISTDAAFLSELVGPKEEQRTALKDLFGGKNVFPLVKHRSAALRCG